MVSDTTILAVLAGLSLIGNIALITMYHRMVKELTLKIMSGNAEKYVQIKKFEEAKPEANAPAYQTKPEDRWLELDELPYEEFVKALPDDIRPATHDIPREV